MYNQFKKRCLNRSSINQKSNSRAPLSSQLRFSGLNASKRLKLVRNKNTMSSRIYNSMMLKWITINQIGNMTICHPHRLPPNLTTPALHLVNVRIWAATLRLKSSTKNSFKINTRASLTIHRPSTPSWPTHHHIQTRFLSPSRAPMILILRCRTKII